MQEENRYITRGEVPRRACDAELDAAAFAGQVLPLFDRLSTPAILSFVAVVVVAAVVVVVAVVVADLQC